jgi:hypothetical protein
VSALQAQSPEFKTRSHQKKPKTKTHAHLHLLFLKQPSFHGLFQGQGVIYF